MSDRKKRAQFERLFMPHLSSAYNVARWLLRNPHDAEDMVQEAYLKAYRSFDNYKGGDPQSWLLTNLRNTCLTWLTRQNKYRKVIDFSDAAYRHDLKHTQASLIASTPSPDVELLAESDRKRVHKALAELPEPYRIVLALREFEELKYRQIAEILDVPVGTVMSRLSRARNELKKRLTDDADEGQTNEL